MKRQTSWIPATDAATWRVVGSSGKILALLTIKDTQLQGNAAPERELVANRSGIAFDRTGDGCHAMDPSMDPGAAEKKRCAREDVTALEVAAQRPEHLVLKAT